MEQQELSVQFQMYFPFVDVKNFISTTHRKLRSSENITEEPPVDRITVFYSQAYIYKQEYNRGHSPASCHVATEQSWTHTGRHGDGQLAWG